MTWNDIILSVLSTLLIGLATWGLSVFTTWMNEKLKDKKSQKLANDALNIVTQCVKSTYQTYVESLKGTALWTKEAQQNALQMAMNAAKKQFNDDIKDYITINYASIDSFLLSSIESVLYDLKK